MDALRAQSEAQAKVLQDQVAQLTSMMGRGAGTADGAAAGDDGGDADFWEGGRRLGWRRPDRVIPSGARVIPFGARVVPSGAAPGSAGAGAGNAGSRARASTPRRDAGRGRRRRRLRLPGANVRDIMSKMDLYEDEAERRRVVSDRFEYEEIGDLVDNDDLHLLTDACAKELGVTDSFIGIIDSKRQIHVSPIGLDVNTGEARAHGDGLYCANVGTVCKHVVKRGDAMQTNESDPRASMAGMPNFTDPEYGDPRQRLPGRDPGRHVCAVRRVRRREFR